MQRFVLIGGMLMAQSFRCYLVGCAGHVLFGIQVCLFQLLRKICVHHSLVCVDVNECVKNNGGCNSKRKCTNTDGGRTCGDCPSGWENNGVTGCKGLLGCFGRLAIIQTFLFCLARVYKLFGVVYW